MVAVVFIGVTAFVGYTKNVQTEASQHPRIATAIKELENAIDYMEKAPHDFGGYKAQAIADSKKAVVSLKHALMYRAQADIKKK